ncbi:MAG: glucose-6-phosphate isomerase family protein [Candidatus Aenigmatarchaeota archaeon]
MARISFGYNLKEKDNALALNFKQKVEGWKRFASQLVQDKVILDLENARKMLTFKGDVVVYEQYHLWKSLEKFKEIFERTRIASDLTLLKFGVYSISKEGELFSTYGHAHETYCGEAYYVIKNDCFLILTEKQTFKTFIIKLRKNDFLFVHPNFYHRTVCWKKDTLFATFYPEVAGHDYSSVKGKGFPFHLFLIKNKLEIRPNPNFNDCSFVFIRKIKKKENPLKLLEKNEKRLKEILFDPFKNEKVYFIGNQT